MPWVEFLDFLAGVRVYVQYSLLIVTVIALLAFIWIDNTRVRGEFHKRLPNHLPLFKRSPELELSVPRPEVAAASRPGPPAGRQREFPTDARPRHRNFLPPSLAPSGSFAVVAAPAPESPPPPPSEEETRPAKKKSLPDDSLRLFKEIQKEALDIADKQKRADQERKKKDREDKEAARLARAEAAKEAEVAKAVGTPASTTFRFNLPALTTSSTSPAATSATTPAATTGGALSRTTSQVGVKI
jgi:hypothetical protein